MSGSCRVCAYLHRTGTELRLGAFSFASLACLSEICLLGRVSVSMFVGKPSLYTDYGDVAHEIFSGSGAVTTEEVSARVSMQEAAGGAPLTLTPPCLCQTHTTR